MDNGATRWAWLKESKVVFARERLGVKCVLEGANDPDSADCQ